MVIAPSTSLNAASADYLDNGVSLDEMTSDEVDSGKVDSDKVDEEEASFNKTI
jgi:hypothetical protein